MPRAPINPKTLTPMIAERMAKLREFSLNEGFTPLTDLDPEFRRLFCVVSGDPDVFIQRLRVIHEESQEGSVKRGQLEAAFYALGIETTGLHTLHQRRERLLAERGASNWNLETLHELGLEETDGFLAIASSYDQIMAGMQKHDPLKEELVAFVRKFAANEKLTLRQQVLLNHAADKADPDGAGPKLQ